MRSHQLALAGALAIAGWLGWDARSALAQTPGTYADFPFQQGSAFYQYRGNVHSNPNAVGRSYRSSRYVAPSTGYAAPVQRAAPVYTAPTTQRRMFYDYRTRQWYYYR